MNELTAFPTADTAAAFRSAMGAVALVLRGQASAAERATEDAALSLLADAEHLLRLVSQLRSAQSDLRRDLAVPPSDGECDIERQKARMAAHERRIDGIVDGIEAGSVGLFANAQSQDVVRQILGGMNDLVGAVCDISLDELTLSPDGAEAPIRAMDIVSTNFVMHEQRVAFAKALGRDPPVDSPSLELF